MRFIQPKKTIELYENGENVIIWKKDCLYEIKDLDEYFYKVESETNEFQYITNDNSGISEDFNIVECNNTMSKNCKNCKHIQTLNGVSICNIEKDG